MHALSKHKTAILIFAFSSKEELRHKRINNAKGLFNTLSEHTLKTVKKTGLSYFHFTEKEQHGINFGERFANAIEFIFKKGFDHIITIGNDTPHLGVSHLLKTAATISNKKVVLGPSTDGGFYLMGLHKNNFDRNSFIALPWQTSNLYKRFITEYISEKTSIIALKSLQDIDNHYDIKRILKFASTVSQLILKLLIAILNTRSSFLQEQVSVIPLFKISNLQVRGSPQIPFSIISC